MQYICIMRKENLHQPFSITYVTLDVCPKQEHTHTFFELVYIISGTGKQCINQNKFSYFAGHMFLITPEDCHSFEIETTTEFLFLRFNDIYIQNGGLPTENIKRLEYILQNANHQPGCILKNQIDKSLVKPMVDAIVRESINADLFNKELIHQLVNTLIIIVARNIAKYLPEQVNTSTEEKAMDILQYIQSNIYHPEKLKAENISTKFGISNAYLGKYFKRHTNETMQQYIATYKTKLIEHRLQFSDKRINEIADEFGFTDESHLNKFFRKQKGSSPKVYRKTIRM
ncbi:AraC-like DNA-binding protein [Flavobacterium gossypii]|uniref:AraC-like DNA-binding protein n=1 Tax=Flavobacterium gossypii TaxID=1646119 RepID=A0ABR6DM17_9FLAO|nr:AraC family transcriptional regulator [Flavobacterium gossypii]MBA9072712.1 AraC-like DNA-binding protein [Flavobacterium gossypii]